MFCSSCGKEIEAGSLFCEHCGAKQEPVPPMVPPFSYAPDIPPQPIAQPQPAVGTAAPPVVSAAPRKPMSKGAKAAIGLISAAAALFFCAKAILTYLNDPNKVIK